MRSVLSIFARRGQPIGPYPTQVGYNLGGVDLQHHTPRPSQPMVLRFPPKGPGWSLVDNQPMPTELKREQTVNVMSGALHLTSTGI
jgi:hypothetical protein